MKTLFLLLAVCIIFPIVASAQLPQTVSYQGLLTSGGTPIADGNYDLTFNLYVVPSGGTSLWTETHIGVPVSNGTFSVTLGSITSLTAVNFNQQLYLGVIQGGNPEFSPRAALTSAPSSLAPWAASGSNISFTSGIVGIGTANPVQALHVSKNGTNTAIMVEDPTSRSRIGMYSFSLGNNEFGFGPVDLQFGTISNNTFTGFSEKMRITTSGNVGIGTTSPLEKLDVNGSISIRNNNSLKIFSDGIGLVATSAPGAYGTFDFYKTGDLNASVRLGHSNFPVARSFSILTGDGTGAATERLTITPTGNVGIGTANPVQALHVSKNGTNTAIMVEDPTARSRIGMYSFSLGNNEFGFGPVDLQFGTISNNTFTGFSEKMRITTSGNVGIGTTSPAYKLDVNGTINATDIYKNGLPLSTSQWVTSGSDIYYNLGNVGIGTTNPQYKLDVDAGSTGIRVTGYGTNNTGYDMVNTDVVTQAWAVLALGNSGTLGPPKGFAVYDRTANTSPFQIDNGAPNASLYMNSAGNVGIGTANPMQALHVSKNGTNTAIMIEDPTARSRIGMYSFSLGNNEFGFGPVDLQFGTISNNTFTGFSEKMRITTSGRVGIGVTNPGNAITLPNNADATGQGLANAWTTYSSRRSKTNIMKLENSLKKVQNLRGVSFDWKGSGKHDIGLIAEEVAEVIPEVVHYEDNGKDVKSIDYARLVALLIEGVKDVSLQNLEQQKEIEELKAMVKTLAEKKHPVGEKSFGELK